MTVNFPRGRGKAWTVHAADGRDWVIRRDSGRQTSRVPVEYEHDVNGGGVGLILGANVMFWAIALYLFINNRPHVPWYFLIFPVLFGIFIGCWWWMTRLWTVIAETAQGEAEYWTGKARGRRSAREAMRVIERDLRTRGTPGRSDGRMERL